MAVIESPTFAGLLDSLRQTGARVIGVPVDEDGFDVALLERLLARHEVKLWPCRPPARTPRARPLRTSAGERLAELAVERNFFVLEDRVYATPASRASPFARSASWLPRT